MDVQRRDDRFLDYISQIKANREKAVTELRFGAMKHPDLKDLFEELEHLLELPRTTTAEADKVIKEPALVL